jgi:hypothetical protein
VWAELELNVQQGAWFTGVSHTYCGIAEVRFDGHVRIRKERKGEKEEEVEATEGKIK